jgi:hypothetical protein
VQDFGLGHSNKSMMSPYQDNQEWRSKRLDHC